MAGLVDTIRNALLRESFSDDYETYEEEDVREEVEPEIVPFRAYKKNAGSKIVNINTNVQMQVVITDPATVEEAGNVCDYIKSKKTVVVNLDGIEYEAAQRITDFLSGACHALDGSIQRVSNNIFVIAPVNVDLTGNFKDELRASGVTFPSWLSQSK